MREREIFQEVLAMRKALRGLLLNSRRLIATTSSKQHQKPPASVHIQASSSDDEGHHHIKVACKPTLEQCHHHVEVAWKPTLERCQVRHCSGISSTSVGSDLCNGICSANHAGGFSPKGSPGAFSNHEARKVLKLLRMEDFKKRLLGTGLHCMPLEKALSLCKETGAATTDEEAEEIAKSLDEAGWFYIFRKKVFLKPEKVTEVLSKAMPLPLAQEDDPRNEEYARLLREKDEIDRLAHKQVRKTLWTAFGALSTQTLVFFRLTFWELSWDVMEPITFFVTSSSLLAGFLFFVVTKRDPSYHDFMNTLLSSKQRKLIKKRNFDLQRFKELEVLCCLPSSHMESHVTHSC